MKLDENNAPIGYIAIENNKSRSDLHPCIDCDFKHIRMIDYGIGCKKPFKDKMISCCAFARSDKCTVHFKKKEST
jgi:hypothetical protein